MKKYSRKISYIVVITICFILLLIINVEQKSREQKPMTKAEKEKQMKEAMTTPLGKYPELITYTLGKMTGDNNSNMPEYDTYEDNAYTRYLKETLNVQNEDAYEANEIYDNALEVAITSNKLPDIMVVNSDEQLETLIQNDMIEDLTDAYNSCASERIKSIYSSYGNGVLKSGKVKDKIMALPETNVEDGPNLLWLRKDWMDQLGLKEPKTMDDAVKIIDQFVKKDIGGNGTEKTVGLVCDSEIIGESRYRSEYQMDIVFAGFGAFPKKWIANESGDISYGSISERTKKGLEYLHDLYKKNILDQNFLLRSNSNIVELICNGQCGSFFGPWWAPNNPLVQAIKNDEKADWRPYLLSTDGQGITSYYSQDQPNKYVVVRKGYEHPEIAVKIISALHDKARYEDLDNNEISRYYKENVDPTARPLVINVDYSNAVQRCFEELLGALNNKKRVENLKVLEQSYYESCYDYLHNTEHTEEQWAAYASRILAPNMLNRGKVIKIPAVYYKETDTMKKEWWQLQELEKDTFLSIITGEKPSSSFDSFVKEWKLQGGEQITKEINDYNKKKEK